MGYINTVTYLDDNLLIITLQKENNVRMFADIKHKTTTYSSTWYSLMSVLRISFVIILDHRVIQYLLKYGLYQLQHADPISKIITI